MKCKRCRERKAEVIFEGLRFCRECFSIYFENQFQRAIEGRGLGERMFSERDKILAGISGGKDSTTCLYLLKKFKFKVTGLYLNLGIGEGFQKAEKLVKNFSQSYGIKILVFDLKKDFGIDLISLFKKHKNKKICGICGTIKRYLLNKIALERRFDVLVTGHNLSDESAFLLKSLLSWDIEALSRQFPILPSKNKKLIRKVKPLFRLTDREIEEYAKIKKINHLKVICPFEKERVSTIKMKEILREIEKRFPGFHHQFYLGFLRNKKLFKGPKIKLRECQLCQMLTQNPDLCAFCKLTKNL